MCGPVGADRLWSRHVRWFGVVAGTLVALSIVGSALSIVGSPAEATPVAPPTTWSVQPASHGRPDTRPYFSYQRVNAGAVLQDEIAVENFGTTPQTFALYASDALNTASGGFDLLPAATAPTDVGAWIRPVQATVQVPAGKQVIVPFTVRVPATATPGFHTGGIVASSRTPGTDAKGNRVTVDRRVGARVYLQVAGPLRPVLAVEHLSVDYSGGWDPIHPGAATVSYALANTGNVPLQAHQQVHLAGLFGAGGKTLAVPDVPLVLPGNSVQVRVQVDGVWAAVRLDTEVRLQPFTSIVVLAPPPAAVYGRTHQWAVPWTWLLALLVILAYVSWRMVRRHHRGAGRDAGLAPGVASEPGHHPDIESAGSAAS